MKLNVEDKEKKKTGLKLFKEYAELTEDEVVITIEHWYGKFIKSIVLIVQNIRAIRDTSRKSTICTRKR